MSGAGRGPWGSGDPIVVFGDDWGRYVSTMQHLFRHIALDYPVVWVNAIGHRPPSLTTRDVRRAIEKLRATTRPRSPSPAATPGLGGGVPRAVIEPRGILPWHDVGPIHWWNTRTLLRAIRGRLAALGLTRPPVLVTGTPPSDGVVGHLGEAASVYLCMDDFLNYPGVSAKMIAPLEQHLLQKVDGLVATAASLTVSKRPASGRTWHLPQGVNFEHFAVARDEPADLAGIPHPRIGYVGRVGGLLDLGLVRKLALAHPQCALVLVGPIVAESRAMEALALPNIHIMGKRPYAELPGYEQHFDVGLIPYVLNDWTRGVDSLKLLEYLAAGLPVVTTAMPEAAKYAEIVTVTTDDDAFVAAVGDALRLDSAAARRHRQAFASGHTWKARSERLLEIIRELVASRPLAA